MRSQWSGRDVLVTGCAGFKGAWLCAVLHELGAKVHGIRNNKAHPDSAYELLDLPKKIVEVRADISNRVDVTDVINGMKPDAIFHLAAKAVVTVCLRDPYRAFLVNTFGTLNILEACRRLNAVNSLVLVSTDHVFGTVKEERLPLDEDSPVQHGGPYDTSKATMEIIARCYHSTYDNALPRTCLTRAANCIGFGDTASRRVVPTFIQAALKTGFIPVTTKKNGRQFVDVADVVSGYIMAASHSPPAFDLRQALPTFHFAIERYEATSEPFIRIEALAEIIAKLTDARVDVQPKCVDFMPNENRCQALSCEKTARSLGWHPKRRFVDTLNDLVTWYRPQTTRNERRQRDSAIS
jgi:CDP-glucose 4,6-dehydratase